MKCPLFDLELTRGLQRGELLALLWTDSDVEKWTVTVNKPMNQGPLFGGAAPKLSENLLVYSRKPLRHIRRLLQQCLRQK